MSVVAFGGCGGAEAPRAETREASGHDPLAGVRDLVALVPDGAEVVIVARPRALLDAPATSQLARALFPEPAAPEVRGPLGAPLFELTELVYALFEGGGLCIARGDVDAPALIRARGERMTSIDIAYEAPDVVRAGYLGRTPRYLRSLGPSAYLDAFDAIGGPLSSVIGWLEASGPSGEGRAPASAALGRLWDRHRDADLVALVPAHLALPNDSGPGMLLAGQRLFAASLRAEGPDRVLVRATFEGSFPPDAEASFRTWVASLSDTDLGRALGMPAGLPTLTVRSEPRRIELSLQLGAAALGRGLRLLFGAEIPEILADETIRF